MVRVRKGKVLCCHTRPKSELFKGAVTSLTLVVEIVEEEQE